MIRAKEDIGKSPLFLTREERAALEAAAKAHGTTATGLVRQMIRQVSGLPSLADLSAMKAPADTLERMSARWPPAEKATALSDPCACTEPWREQERRLGLTPRHQWWCGLSRTG